METPLLGIRMVAWPMKSGSRNGNREGLHKGYWPSGQLQFEYRYKNDLFEGEQVGYYKNGQRSELRHYHLGYEEGRSLHGMVKVA